MKKLSVALLLGVLSACTGERSMSGDAGGTLIISTGPDAGTLVPPLIRSTSGLQVAAQIFERLADMREGGNTAGSADFVPRLAESWEWASDSLSIRFNLNGNARWHDGRAVRARDVAYTLSLYKDPLVFDDAVSMGVIDSVSTPDSLTAVFWFSRRDPEQFFIATYHMLIVPEHVLSLIPREELSSSSFNRNPIGSGPFRMVRSEPGAVIELAADTSHYRGRPPLDRVIISIAGDFTTAVTRVIAGDADFFEAMQPDGLEEMKRNPDVVPHPYLGTQYTFIAFNFRERNAAARPHGILADHGVRRALSMAVDRQAAISNVWDTLAYVALGPFVRSMSMADTATRQIPFDTAAAARMLDSLGWKIPDGGEFREKGGRKLEFGLLLPATSRARQRTAILVKEDLRRVGVNMIIEETDFATFSARLTARDFDAYYGAWQMNPTPTGLRQTWSPPRDDGAGSLNHGSYNNLRLGAVVDSAVAEFDPARRTALFRRAYQTIVDDAPAIWMYEPRQVAAAHARLVIPSLPAYGWWESIEKWSVNPEKRIARDMVGIR